MMVTIVSICLETGKMVNKFRGWLELKLIFREIERDMRVKHFLACCQKQRAADSARIQGVIK